MEAAAPLNASYKLSQLKQVLDELKTQSHGTEANLADVLSPKTTSHKKNIAHLQKEGKKLLVEVGIVICKSVFQAKLIAWCPLFVHANRARTPPPINLNSFASNSHVKHLHSYTSAEPKPFLLFHSDTL